MKQETSRDEDLGVTVSQRSDKWRFWVATLLNWLVVAGLLFVGIDYVTCSEPKPHHLQMLDVPFHELPPGTAGLIMILLRGTGMVALVTSLSLSTLLITPFRRRENWSRWAILTIAGFTLIPTLLKTFEVRWHLGADAPWWPHVLMLAMLGIAFWLTRDFSSRKR